MSRHWTRAVNLWQVKAEGKNSCGKTECEKQHARVDLIYGMMPRIKKALSPGMYKNHNAFVVPSNGD